MALLNSHKLTLYERTNRNNSFLKRRRKLIANINEQIRYSYRMKTKPLTFLLALTFLFLFSGSSVVFADDFQDG